MDARNGAGNSASRSEFVGCALEAQPTTKPHRQLTSVLIGPQAASEARLACSNRSDNCEDGDSKYSRKPLSYQRKAKLA